MIKQIYSTQSKVKLQIKKIIKKYPDLWKLKKYEKGILLLQEGNKLKQNFYIESGSVKSFVVNTLNQTEAVISFYTAEDLILVYRNDLPENIDSILNLKVIENAEIYSIDSNDWDKLLKKEPLLLEILKEDLLDIFNKLLKRIEIGVIPTAKLKYDKFVQIHPLLQYLSAEDIASYLGVSVRTVKSFNSKK